MDTTTQLGIIPENAAKLLATHFVGGEHEGAEVLEVATALVNGELVIEAAYEHEGRRGYARFELDAWGGCTAYEGAEELLHITPCDDDEDDEDDECSFCYGSGGGDFEHSCRFCGGSGLRRAA
jgi:hypothetical protein